MSSHFLSRYWLFVALLVALTSGHVDENGDSDEATVEVEQTEGEDIVTVSHLIFDYDDLKTALLIE